MALNAADQPIGGVDGTPGGGSEERKAPTLRDLSGGGSSQAQDPLDPASEADLDQLVNLFKLLSDKTRLRILSLLTDGERNVSWLCDALNLPQPKVSHHLGLLRMSRVIDNRREGKQVYYALSPHVTCDKTSLCVHLPSRAVTIAQH